MVTDDGGEPAFPPTVFVPSARVRPGDAELSLELRTLADGRTALLAYSTLDRLVDGCGPAQPWASIRADRLSELREHFDVVLVDAELPEGLRAQPDDTEPTQPTEPTRPSDLAESAGRTEPTRPAARTKTPGQR